MRKKEPYQTPVAISVEIDGESYSGSYTSHKGMIRVDSPFGSGVIEDKTGRGDPWAKQRLRELVRRWLVENQE